MALRDCTCPCCTHMRSRTLFCQTIAHMPSCTAQRLVSLMLVPLLYSFSDLLPLVFPREWIGARPSSIVAKTTVRGAFRELCILVQYVRDMLVDPKLSYDLRNEVFMFHGEASGLLDWITQRRRWGTMRSGERRVMRMKLRIQQLQGKDMVHSRLYTELSAIACNVRDPVSVSALLQFACDVGGVEHMLQMSRGFRTRSAAGSRFNAYLDRLIARLCFVRRVDYACALAVAMALHPRLGSASALGDLGCDILPRCVPWIQASPIPMWQEVIGVCFRT